MKSNKQFFLAGLVLVLSLSAYCYLQFCPTTYPVAVNQPVTQELVAQLPVNETETADKESDAGQTSDLSLIKAVFRLGKRLLPAIHL